MYSHTPYIDWLDKKFSNKFLKVFTVSVEMTYSDKLLHKFTVCTVYSYYAPAPRVGALSDDARLTSV